MTFLDFLETLVRASNELYAQEIRERVFPKLLSAEELEVAFVTNAAIGAAGSAEDAALDDDHDGDRCGLGVNAKPLFDKFVETLSPVAQGLAQLLFKTHTSIWGREFLMIAQAELQNTTFQFNFAELFKDAKDKDKAKEKATLEVPELREACQGWIHLTSAQPKRLEDKESAIGDIDRALRKASKADEAAEEEEDKIRTATTINLEQCLRSSFKVYALETPSYSNDNLNAWWREAKSEMSKPEKSRKTLFLLSAELFPGHALQHTPDTFRGVIGGIDKEFKQALAWMFKARTPTDIVVVSDGRSESARRQIRKEFETEFEQGFTELWLIYEGESALGRDPRNPKRKLAWSGVHNEVLFASLSSATKGQRKCVSREVFTRCGESTNYSKSYTGIQSRTLEEIPRLTAQDKAKILGSAAIGAFNRDRVAKDVDAKGHPLFWSEWKPISLYTALCRDFDVTDVVDLGMGSGAAGIGALCQQCSYIGLRYNDLRKFWVWRFIQQCLLALVSDGKAKVDADIVAKVKQYFQRAVTAARQWLPPGADRVVLVKGNDDSDMEE